MQAALETIHAALPWVIGAGVVALAVAGLVCSMFPIRLTERDYD